VAVRIIQAEGRERDAAILAAAHPDACLLDWRSEQRNALLDCSALPLPDGPQRALGLDFLDVAVGVYLADLASLRGRNEDWVRDLDLELAVREVDFWRAHQTDLTRLLHRFTGDNLRLRFVPRREEADAPCGGASWLHTDSVCLVSGGLDSAAAAVMLLRTGRHPRLVMHRSGNPMVTEAQDRLAGVLEGYWPDQSRVAAVRLSPSSHRTHALPFPPPEQRESSRRCRSFLFMTLGALAAAGEGVNEVYLCDNALLSAGVPLTEARSGSFTTHSTHPAALAQFNGLLAAAGWPVTVQNPFMYQTKGEIIRTFLQPVLTPQEISQTVSCWAVGRHQRQCGGCVPCLLRRFGLLRAGIPDEVFAADVLASPDDFRGTEAHRNLVDLLGWSMQVLSTPEMHLPLHYPSLLEMQAGGADLMDTIRALRRQAMEIFEVTHRCFPEAARLMGELH
jgi:7-cyano-7-deazaguanine synthase in queuosine biosynthesis